MIVQTNNTTAVVTTDPMLVTSVIVSTTSTCQVQINHEGQTYDLGGPIPVNGIYRYRFPMLVINEGDELLVTSDDSAVWEVELHPMIQGMGAVSEFFTVDTDWTAVATGPTNVWSVVATKLSIAEAQFLAKINGLDIEPQTIFQQSARFVGDLEVTPGNTLEFSATGSEFHVMVNRGLTGV